MKMSFSSLVVSVVLAFPFANQGFAGASLAPQQGEKNTSSTSQQVCIDIPVGNIGNIEGPGKTSQSINEEERQALWLIHVVNLTDIKASLLAFEKDTTAEAKNMAVRIISERLRSEVELQSLAMKYGLKLEDESSAATLVPLNEASESLIQDLQEVPSAVFAQAFSERMNTSHKNLTEDLQDREPSFESIEIRDFVIKTVEGVQYLISDENSVERQ